MAASAQAPEKPNATHDDTDCHSQPKTSDAR
jgi:hypothetical protein